MLIDELRNADRRATVSLARPGCLPGGGSSRTASPPRRRVFPDECTRRRGRAPSPPRPRATFPAKERRAAALVALVEARPPRRAAVRWRSGARRRWARRLRHLRTDARAASAPAREKHCHAADGAEAASVAAARATATAIDAKVGNAARGEAAAVQDVQQEALEATQAQLRESSGCRRSSSSRPSMPRLTPCRPRARSSSSRLQPRRRRVRQLEAAAEAAARQQEAVGTSVAAALATAHTEAERRVTAERARADELQANLKVRERLVEPVAACVARLHEAQLRHRRRGSHASAHRLLRCWHVVLGGRALRRQLCFTPQPVIEAWQRQRGRASSHSPSHSRVRRDSGRVVGGGCATLASVRRHARRCSRRRRPRRRWCSTRPMRSGVQSSRARSHAGGGGADMRDGKISTSHQARFNCI